MSVLRISRVWVAILSLSLLGAIVGCDKEIHDVEARPSHFTPVNAPSPNTVVASAAQR